MPNLQSITNKLESQFSTLCSKPDFTTSEVVLMQEAAAKWHGKFSNIAFSGRDAIMLAFFRSPEFKSLCESPGLIQKIIAAERHLNQLDPSVYPRMKSDTIDVTFGSILKFGLPMAASTDYLRLGTENADHDIYIHDPDASNIRLALAADREKRYQENTLPGLQAIAKELGISAEFAQDPPVPAWKSNLGARWRAISGFLLSLDDPTKGKVIDVPNYANTSMIDQAHWWMSDMGCKDSTDKVVVSTFFREQKQASQCSAGKEIQEYPRSCTIPSKYANLDALTDYFLDNQLLLDEWFGHMMTDRAHLESLVFAEYPEYTFSDGSKCKMHDIIGDLCTKVQTNPQKYKEAADQLNLRLGRIEDHLASKHSYKPEVGVTAAPLVTPPTGPSPINQELLAAVKNTQKLLKDKKQDRINALDALLKATNAQEFRFAVLNDQNYRYWIEMDNKINQRPTTVLQGASWNDYNSIARFQQQDNPIYNDEFISSQVRYPTFNDIKQAAAEERVKESLADVEPNVLIGILKNNDAACRQYLEEKLRSKINFSQIHGWAPANENVLTKGALKNIKIEAANVLLLNLLSDDRLMASKPELKDPKLYEDLTSGDFTKIKNAAKKIIDAARPGLDLETLSLDDVVNTFTRIEDFATGIFAKAQVRSDKILEQAKTILLDALSKDALLADPELKKPELYEKLISGNLTQVQEAVRTIVSVRGVDRKGFSVDNIVNAFTKPDVFDLMEDPVIKKAAERKKQVVDERNVDEFNRQFAAFESSHDDKWLLSNSNKLNYAKTEDFLDNLVPLLNQEDNNPYKDQILALGNDKKQEIGKVSQQRLCERFLKALLLQNGINSDLNLPEILKAKDREGVVSKLKADQGEHPIIDHAITPQNFASFQVALVKNHIDKMGRDSNIAHLALLGKASDLQDFKTKLASVMRAEVDFIKEADFIALMKEIRIQHFQLIVDEGSRLGRKAHSGLINVFSNLPAEKQKELVENPKKLSLIINSPDHDVLKHYLGKNVNVVALAEENERNSAFKKIHNAAIARALADYDPLLSLTDEQIEHINEAIKEAVDKDLLQFLPYKALIDNIRQQCSILESRKAEFYQAFNIKTLGDNFVNDIADQSYSGIDYQHHYNNHLLKDTELDENLRDVLLIIDKQQTGVFDSDDIENIKTKFKDSKNIEDFFKQWPREATATRPLNEAEQALRSALMKELTPALFHTIKIDQKKNEFAGADNQNRDRIIRERDDSPELKQIQEYNVTLSVTHNQSLIDLRNLKESHNHTLALTGKPKKEILEMQKRYKDLNTDCINIVSQLEDNLRTIEALKVSEFPVNINPMVKIKAEALNKELEKQEKLIKDGINAYTDLAKRTAKRLVEIDDALNKQLLYTPKGLKIYRQDRNLAGRVNAAVPNPTDPKMISDREADRLSAIESPGPDKDLFKRTGKPEPGEIICFDFSETRRGFQNADETENRNEYQINSRFTYDPVSQKFEMQFLQGSTADGQKVPLINLRDDLVDMSMNMVMQELLKRLDNNNPPTKDDPITLIGIKQRPYEVEYLHAACMAFGISPDAILVKGNAGFNPESQLDRGWLKTSPKEDDSTYSTVFQENNALKNDLKIKYVDEYNKKVQEKSDAKKAAGPVDNKVKQLEKREEFAKIRAEGKAKEEANRDREVPEVISSDVAKLRNQ